MFSHLMPALATPAISLPPVLVQYLTSDSPLRFWAFALALCIILTLPRATRRLGGFGFFGIAGALCVYMGMNSMIASVTPK